MKRSEIRGSIPAHETPDYAALHPGYACYSIRATLVPGTGMVPIGIATIAAGNGVTTVHVRLNGVATEAA